MKKSWKLIVLAAIFGMGSWIAITGLWLEMPLLIANLPEGWRLPSRLNIIIQLANAGPLIYWAASKLQIADEVSGTHAQMIIGIISCAVLVFAWNMTTTFAGSEHSIVLFICTFGLALVDCTSSVTFLVFMARFDSYYMTPYLVGEGLSGLIPSMVTAAQGVGDEPQDCASKLSIHNNSSDPIEELTGRPQFEPRFSIEVFFLSLFATITISYLAFCLLQWLPFCKREMSRVLDERTRASLEKDSEFMELTKLDNAIIFQGEGVKCSGKCNQTTVYYFLLALMLWNCFTTFGFFPSVQPYSALPYGAQTMHYVVLLSGLSYPIGCFLGMLYQNRSIKAIVGFSLIGTLIGVYIVTCSVLSPRPPLVDSPFGGPLMVLSWILFTLTLSYAKTMATVWICQYNAQEGMFWVGMNTQLGAALGAFLNFGLVNWASGIFNEC